MKYLLLFFTAITSISVSALGRNELQIIENAGQFKGDFDYLLRTPGTDVAINNTGLYYIFYRRMCALLH